jgi:VWFA-related protein
MMSVSFSTIIILLVFTVLPPGALLGSSDNQDEKPQASVVYKVTDALVRDRKGQFVEDLKVEDFVLKIEGKPANIKFVEEYSIPTQEAILAYEESVRRAQAAGNRPPSPPRPPNLIIIVFDQSNLGTQASQNARETARRIVLEACLPWDLVTVLRYNGFFITLLSPTSDREKILAAIDAAGEQNLNPFYIPTMEECKARIKKQFSNAIGADNQYFRGKLEAFLSYIRSFTALASTSNRIDGKKTCVFFSEGPNIYPYSVSNFIPSQHERLVRLFNSANTSLYTIVPGPSEREWFSISYPLLQSQFRNYRVETKSIFYTLSRIKYYRENFLRRISNLTGGEFFDSPRNMETILEGIRQDNNHYYIIGFEPPDGEPETFYPVRIEVKRSGCRVKQRTGFFSKKSFAALTAEERLAHLVESLFTPGLVDELELNATVYELKTHPERSVILGFELPRKKLARIIDSGYELELTVIVTDQKGNIGFAALEILRYNGEKDLPEKVWLAQSIPVSKNRSTICLLVRDNRNGNISSLSLTMNEREVSQGNPEISDIIFLSQEAGGCLMDWEHEAVRGQIILHDSNLSSFLGNSMRPSIANNFKVGDVAELLLVVSNVPLDFSVRNAELKIDISAVSVDGREESIEPNDLKAKYNGATNEILISAAVPIGKASHPESGLRVRVFGVKDDMVLTATSRIEVVSLSDDIHNN